MPALRHTVACGELLLIAMLSERGREITLNDLKRYAGNFLEVLAQERIANVNDLQAKIHSGVRASSLAEEYVVFEIGSSVRGTKAYVLDYAILGVGVPIEGRINTNLDYAEMIVKVQASLVGYEPITPLTVGTDPAGNIRQWKFLQSASVEEVKNELERIRTQY